MTTLHSQKVVLVNGEAAAVELEGSQVTAINRQLPNYMRGFIKPGSDIFLKAPLFPGEEAAVAEDTGVEKPVLLANAVFFENNSAILSNKTIESLKKYAQTAQKNGPKTIILKSWYEVGNENSQELVNNRLEACKEFLEINGVQGSLIFTSFTGADEETDYVTVTFQ